jgi:hypothetical protein
VKIASQRLWPYLPPNLCVLRAHCGESLRPFRIITLRIALPVTPLFSQPSALPGGVSPLWPQRYALGALLCRAFSCNSFAVNGLQPLAPLFALFSALPPFVFNHFQPLFRKYPGWGVPFQSGTAISGCPPTISQQSSTSTKWRTDDSKTRSPIQPTFGVPPLASPNL